LVYTQEGRPESRLVPHLDLCTNAVKNGLILRRLSRIKYLAELIYHPKLMTVSDGTSTEWMRDDELTITEQSLPGRERQILAAHGRAKFTQQGLNVLPYLLLSNRLFPP
jgi:hypothetical protein